MGHLGSALVEELERRRVEQGMSKQRLARILGISRHTVARKLTEETELSVGEAYDLCKALGTSLQDMLDLVGMQHADGA